MSKDTMTGAMDQTLSNLGPHPGPNAALEERISCLETQMSSALEHIVALENNVGKISITALSIRLTRLENAVRAFREAMESLR